MTLHVTRHDPAPRSGDLQRRMVGRPTGGIRALAEGVSSVALMGPGDFRLFAETAMFVDVAPGEADPQSPAAIRLRAGEELWLALEQGPWAFCWTDETGGGTPTPTPGAPVFTSAPTIGSDGSPTVGELLVGGDGAITDGSVSARQWLLGGSPIAGATGGSFTPTQAGDHSFRVTATGPGGSTTATSAAINVAGSANAPIFTIQPSIASDGTPAVGELLAGSDGTISNGAVSARQWLRAGSPITGATGASHTPAQAGQYAYRVTATGPGGDTTATSAPVTVAAGGTGPLPISTPIIVEGDSNTSWTYGNQANWLKRALAYAGGRFYLPPGGDYANGGATIGQAPGDGANSMEGRQAAVVARIQEMIADFGRCVVYFQIGTNGNSDGSGDAAKLAAIVQAYKAAGAIVWCNLAPEWAPSAYRTAVNGAIRNGTVPVDGYVDPTPALTQAGAGTTHYDEAESAAVGNLVATFLRGKITTDTIYTDPLLVVDALAGTGGNVGASGTGQLPDGWTATKTVGDGTAAFSMSGPDPDGRYTMRIAVTAGAQLTTFRVAKSHALAFATGDVIDGGATITGVAATDADSCPLLYTRIGDATFPKNANSKFVQANWAQPSVWRGLPVNQTSGGATINKEIWLSAAAGKSVTIDVKGVFHCVREGSATIAPVNTVAPVLSPAYENGTASCTNGTWTGTPAPSFIQQLYLGETPIEAGYVFQAADIGKTLTCFVTGANSAGQATAESNSVTVQAAPQVATYAVVAPAAATEGDSGAKQFVFTVNRTVNTSTAETVSWAIGGTVNAQDFVGGTLPSGTVAFAAGDTAKTFTVSIAGDTTLEPDETLTATISAPNNGGIIGTASASTTVQNDDVAPAGAKWDTTFNSSAAVAYSNGDRTVTRTANNGTLAARTANTAGAGSGKRYLQLVVGATGAGPQFFGFCDSTIPATGGNASTNGINRVGVAAALLHYFSGTGGATRGNDTAPALGELFELVLDFDAKLYWIKRAGDDWNNDPTANPANAGSGGLSCAGLTSAAYVFGLVSGTQASSLTINTINSEFVGGSGAVPAGCTAWGA